jgi:hypothetical protein
MLSADIPSITVPAHVRRVTRRTKLHQLESMLAIARDKAENLRYKKVALSSTPYTSSFPVQETAIVSEFKESGAAQDIKFNSQQQ